MEGKLSVHQNLMDDVYDKWQQLVEQGAKTDRLSIIEKYFTEKHRVAVQLGNMNYQVYNGGWSQWHYNGYSEDLEDLIEIAKNGVNLKITHFDKILEILTNIFNLGSPKDYDYTKECICYKCDGTGNVLLWDEDDNEYEETCSECGGEGRWEEDIDGEQEYCDMLSKYDDEYYNIDENEILESFEKLIQTY